ncbi:hypothetical protein FA95DRAFT_1609218 [Auriscalpium vulgare]|uniref:Uncharacterized protein n=1 Tax=Auriscalpium vulgare TaxID=40419 RepID=A0ACB8RI97_9AGAM|nr:hypothetical protein FA95DRAFT_1609218 [Auriscalpium vulgare]
MDYEPVPAKVQPVASLIQLTPQLTNEDRMMELQQEMAALLTAQAERQAQKERRQAALDAGEFPQAMGLLPGKRERSQRVPEVVILKRKLFTPTNKQVSFEPAVVELPEATEDSTSKQGPPNEDTAGGEEPPSPPIHPFAKVPDAIYVGPTSYQRNAGQRKADSAYNKVAPVRDPVIANKVYEQAMNTEVTLTQRELMSIAPEVHVQVHNVVTPK